MRPVEWLLEMTQSERGYSDLLDQAGGLAAAAWRLARAKCEVREHATGVSTRLEVKAAARELSRRCLVYLSSSSRDTPEPRLPVSAFIK